MKESFKLKVTLKAKPKEIYNAWLSSKLHSEMTGGVAKCNSKIGGTFSAWDGYISGKNKELVPNKEIVQTWRTSEFDDQDEDSYVAIKLKEKQDSTEITLVHTNIPEGQTQYKKGWIDHYFEPMHQYFEENS